MMAILYACINFMLLDTSAVAILYICTKKAWFITFWNDNQSLYYKNTT